MEFLRMGWIGDWFFGFHASGHVTGNTTASYSKSRVGSRERGGNFGILADGVKEGGVKG
jgi:hypothetical protein